MNTVIKINPDVSVARCEERVAFWTETERRARARAAELARPPTPEERTGGCYWRAGDGRMFAVSSPAGPLLKLAAMAEHARKVWGEALEIAMGRERSA